MFLSLLSLYGEHLSAASPLSHPAGYADFREIHPYRRKQTFSNQSAIKILFGAGMGEQSYPTVAPVSQWAIGAVGHTPSPPRGFSHWNFTFRKQSQPSPSSLSTFAGITEQLKKFP